MPFATWNKYFPAAFLHLKSPWENNMLRGVLLWMLGIPIPIIILLWLFLD